jgi:hypothetical protein
LGSSIPFLLFVCPGPGIHLSFHLNRSVFEEDREVNGDEFHEIVFLSFHSIPFYSYSGNAPSMPAVRFESGKKRGIKEKLFPFLGMGSKE